MSFGFFGKVLEPILKYWGISVYSGFQSLSDVWLVNIVFQSVTWLFIFLAVFFNEQMFLTLMKLTVFKFMITLSKIYQKNLCLTQGHTFFCFLLEV